jgi:hypothetical protein
MIYSSYSTRPRSLSGRGTASQLPVGLQLYTMQILSHASAQLEDRILFKPVNGTRPILLVKAPVTWLAIFQSGIFYLENYWVS